MASRPKINFSAGQTLIETLAGLFILVMGVSAAVALAVYALATSTNITKQIIAVGLARQGLEAVRNMRDTNWLQGSYTINNCFDYVANANNKANCYTAWLDLPYNIDPRVGAAATGVSNYFLGFNPSSANYWVITSQPASGGNYGLNFDPANAGGIGFYYPGSNNSSVSCATSNSGYCRKIIITASTPAGSPYDPATYGGTSQNPGPLIEVQSQVWWTGKNCPSSNDWPGTGQCSIELDTYLTNWKNYQN